MQSLAGVRANQILMTSLLALYNRYLKSKALVKTKTGEDMTTVLPLLKRVDPKQVRRLAQPVGR